MRDSAWRVKLSTFGRTLGLGTVKETWQVGGGWLNPFAKWTTRRALSGGRRGGGVEFVSNTRVAITLIVTTGEDDSPCDFAP